jgi:eukaryotic-like serine/threonine-protein kinase
VTKLTKDGALFGTPGFIPPEALLDAGKFDGRGDLYALGAVAYELLAGRPPFDRGNADELWQSHLTLTPPPASVRLGRPLPRDLEMLVMRMLAKDPARRPQSANETRDLLDACTECGTWTQAEARAWWKAQGEAAASSVQRRDGDPDSTRRFAGGSGS